MKLKKAKKQSYKDVILINWKEISVKQYLVLKKDLKMLGVVDLENSQK